MALSVALGAGAVLAAVGLLTTSGYLISRAAQHPDILRSRVAIVGVRFFGISRALLRYAERLVSHDLAFRTLTDLRTRFFRRLIPLVPGGVPGLGRGELLSRFVGDVDRLQDLYLRGTGSAAGRDPRRRRRGRRRLPDPSRPPPSCLPWRCSPPASWPRP